MKVSNNTSKYCICRRIKASLKYCFSRIVNLFIPLQLFQTLFLLFVDLFSALDKVLLSPVETLRVIFRYYTIHI